MAENPEMTVNLVASARKAMRVLELYSHTHEDIAKAALRERLSDLTLMGEDEIVRGLLHELHEKGIALPK